MAEKPVYGGHDCEFVQEVSDRLNCNICSKVLRDPHLAVCCGQHFCESCLNKWFARQDKESCPHCRAEGEAFHHVIDKSVRRAVNELKIRCSNHGEGCQWIGELGELKKHLESDKGCGFVIVECPNKCITLSVVSVMRRKCLHEHLILSCYLRPYQYEFCGLEDTYEAITGDGYFIFIGRGENDYYGHQAECPEAPLTCPNICGSEKIKRKDLETHCSQCPKEPVECLFAEAGCKVAIYRHQLESHMTSNQQQHLVMMMKDYKKTKTELHNMKIQLDDTKIELNETKTKLAETNIQLNEAEAKLSIADHMALSNKLQKKGDFVKFQMPKFSEYRRSGKVWHSPPFYYREGYKMCLAVYANGVWEGAGTHVSVEILHLGGVHDDQLKWPMQACYAHLLKTDAPDGSHQFLVCLPLQHKKISEHKQINFQDKFCSLNSKALHLVNDCLTFKVEYDKCYLKVWIV